MSMPYGRDFPDPDETSVDDAAAKAADDARARAALLVDLQNGDYLNTAVFPPLAYAVPGLLPEGSTLLVGPPKIGKSWMVLGFALAIAAGGRALGQIRVPQRPVLYLALEDGHRRLQDRCRILLGTDPIPSKFEYLIAVMPGTVFPTIKAWLERHADEPPGLVILDTLGKVMPPTLAGESAYQRDYRIGSTIKRLCDEHPGLTLLVNHHDRKATSDDFVDSVSGTHGLAGAADTIITLTRQRHDAAGLLKVTGRDVVEGEYAVTLDGAGAWRIDGTDLAASADAAVTRRATANLGDRQADVLTHVNANPEGVRAGDIASKLGLDAKQAGVYLGRLADAGKVVRLSRGLYGRLPTPAVGTVGSVGSEPGDPTGNNTYNGSNTTLWSVSGEPV